MRKIFKIFALTLSMVMLFSILYVNEGYAKESKKLNNRVTITKNTSYNSKGITLHWEKVKNVSGYEIYRKVGKSGKYTLVKKISGNKTVKWRDTSIETKKTYFYKIRTYKTKNKNTQYGKCSKEYKKGAIKNNVSAVTQYTYVPYVSGGRSTRGWDCSGFTQWALKEYYGVSIPKTAASQGASGKKISKNNRSKWQPGDVLLYSNGSRISHVALYIGDGKLMHALSTKYGTIIQDVSYYERWDSGTHLVGVRRFH